MPASLIHDIRRSAGDAMFRRKENPRQFSGVSEIAAELIDPADDFIAKP
jgi:hypothetical protein